MSLAVATFTSTCVWVRMCVFVCFSYTCGRHEGKEHLPEQGQEVHDVVAARRQPLLALLAFLVLVLVSCNTTPNSAVSSRCTTPVLQLFGGWKNQWWTSKQLDCTISHGTYIFTVDFNTLQATSTNIVRSVRLRCFCWRTRWFKIPRHTSFRAKNISLLHGQTRFNYISELEGFDRAVFQWNVRENTLFQADLCGTLLN